MKRQDRIFKGASIAQGRQAEWLKNDTRPRRRMEDKVFTGYEVEDPYLAVGRQIAAIAEFDAEMTAQQFINDNFNGRGYD